MCLHAAFDLLFVGLNTGVVASLDLLVSHAGMRAYAWEIGRLYTTPGCFFTRAESSRRVTLLQSNVYGCLHENSSQAGSAPLAG